MKLITGLGNPGKQYENTRHNAGFMVMDEIAKKLNANFQSSRFKGLVASTRIGNEPVLLLKPQTYMNLSGESVGAIMQYYQISPADLLVIYDDKDIEVGKLRLRQKGSSGGQNGVKNIIQNIGTQDFSRIRVGIGNNNIKNMADYVLSPVEKANKEIFDAAIQSAAEAAIESVTHSFVDVMTKYNSK